MALNAGIPSYTRIKNILKNNMDKALISLLIKTEILILDDFGLHAFDNQSREILLDIIDERHNQASTILSSQIPVSAWYDLIGEQTIADAVLDRIVNSSHRIILKGESLRKGKISTNQ